MVLCPVEKTFSHDYLPIGRPCPRCGGSPDVESSSASSSAPPASTSTSSMTAGTPATITSATSVGIDSAFLISKRASQAIALSASTTSRATAMARSASNAPPPLPVKTVKFVVALVHVTWKGDVPEFYSFPERWSCSVTYGTPLIQRELEHLLLNAGRNTEFNNGLDNLYTHGGEFKLSSNFLTPKALIPILWSTWLGKMNVEDIVTHQGYKTGNKGFFPVSLIWYPWQERATSPPFWDDKEQTPMPPSPTPLPSIGDVIGMAVTGGHKRAISDAVPRSERPNGRDNGRDNKDHQVTEEDVEAEQANDGERDDGEAPRRSTRARKPTKKGKERAEWAYYPLMSLQNVTNNPVCRRSRSCTYPCATR